jgi:LemA protein
MKNSIIIIAILAIVALFGITTFNGLGKKNNVVEESWGKVQSQYQRRSDLIPNLVNTVKGVANFEKGTLEAVINARASATKITVDPKNLTPEKLAEFQAAQGQLSSALGRLMVVSEQYPQLKANESFRDLQAQIEGTENRITVARDGFNESIKGFNDGLVTFPSNIFAKLFGFVKKSMFEAENNAQTAPTVNFDEPAK